eukprot:scaffold334650_cov32-Attheya_sp.AAC.2
MPVYSQVPSLHPTTAQTPSMAPSLTVTSPQSPTAVTTLAPMRRNIRGTLTRRPSLLPLQEPEGFCSGSNSSPTRVCQSSVECVLQSLFEQTNGCECTNGRAYCPWFESATA